MKERQVVRVESRITGGHWALKNAGSKTAFTNKMTEAMCVKLRPDDVVADIGGYVGEYSLYANTQGVRRIYTYEPTPDTFRILERNQRGAMQIYQQAVTGDRVASVNLYTSDGIGVTNSIAKKTRKKGVVRVPAVRYQEALRDATVVKIDVEGAEYSYDVVQPQLRAIIIEFHPIEKVDWQSQAQKMMADIRAAGFRPLREPSFSNGWDCHAAYER